MKEVLLRSLKLGNLVLYNSEYYLVTSDERIFNKYEVVPERSVYLIDRPLEQEVLIYNNLVSSYNNYLKLKREKDIQNKERLKKSKETVKDFKPGDILAPENKFGRVLYLGICEYTDVDDKVYKGHMYLKSNSSIMNEVQILDDNIDINKYLYGYYIPYLSDETNLKEELPKLNNNVLKVFKNKSNYYNLKISHVDININKFVINVSYKLLDTSQKSLFESSYYLNAFPVLISLLN